MTSFYPDGSLNGNWERLRVVLPPRPSQQIDKVPPRLVTKVVCHRYSQTGFEEYLVQWRPTSPRRAVPHSWHKLDELSDCLAHVQDYLGSLSSRPISLLGISRKRRPDGSLVQVHVEGSASISRSSSISRAGSISSQTSASTPASSISRPEIDAYNGTIHRANGIVSMGQPGYLQPLNENLPTTQMIEHAKTVDTTQAQYRIRAAFDQLLSSTASGTRGLEIVNQVDGSRPPLRFRFINQSVLRAGVEKAPEDVITGCGYIAAPIGHGGATRKCQPNMGQDIGCEYSRVCECLEFASVDEKKLNEDDKRKFDRDDTAGLPKRFPYFTDGRLVPFYLNTRDPVYECNPRCRCGAYCKTRVVQKGRTIPLQIFKTRDRGWGLRCKILLQRGQFIDTYRGEIITDAEATKREEQAIHGLKASYLYSLDKHALDDDDESNPTAPKRSDCYIVDGEYMGGPTRFINHSCDPNVRQFTVSYNKYDFKIYELAFFALEDIPAMTELTFDYQDLDEEEDEDNEQNRNFVSASQGSATQTGTTRMDCRCGSRRCRGTFWI